MYSICAWPDIIRRVVFTWANVSRTTRVQPLITILFTLLLSPITTALLPALLLSIITWVDAGFATADFGCVGFFGVGFFGVGFFGVGFFGVGFFLSWGHLLQRAALHSSRRSFTTDKESVNLRFSVSKLSITNAARSESFVSDAEFLHPVSIIIVVAIGRAKHAKNRLVDELVFIFFPFCSVDVFKVDKSADFVKQKSSFIFFFRFAGICLF